MHSISSVFILFFVTAATVFSVSAFPVRYVAHEGGSPTRSNWVSLLDRDTWSSVHEQENHIQVSLNNIGVRAGHTIEDASCSRRAWPDASYDERAFTQSLAEWRPAHDTLRPAPNSHKMIGILKCLSDSQMHLRDAPSAPPKHPQAQKKHNSKIGHKVSSMPNSSAVKPRFLTSLDAAKECLQKYIARHFEGCQERVSDCTVKVSYSEIGQDSNFEPSFALRQLLN